MTQVILFQDINKENIVISKDVKNQTVLIQLFQSFYFEFNDMIILL